MSTTPLLGRQRKRGLYLSCSTLPLVTAAAIRSTIMSGSFGGGWVSHSWMWSLRSFMDDANPSDNFDWDKSEGNQAWGSSSRLHGWAEHCVRV